MLTETDKAYLAGIFDGEGCISICRQPPRSRPDRRRKNGSNYIGNWCHTLHISVGMQDFEAIKLFYDNFGGSFHNYTEKSNGIYVWRCSSQTAVIVLEILLPYLRYKKRQAETGISFQKNKGKFTNWHNLTPVDIQNRDSYYNQLKLDKTPRKLEEVRYSYQ